MAQVAWRAPPPKVQPVGEHILHVYDIYHLHALEHMADISKWFCVEHLRTGLSYVSKGFRV